jgi:hypothetical protein
MSIENPGSGREKETETVKKQLEEALMGYWRFLTETAKPVPGLDEMPSRAEAIEWAEKHPVIAESGLSDETKERVIEEALESVSYWKK